MPATTPQDHKKAAEAEAVEADMTFDFDGHTYVVPRENADNIELFEMIEDEKNFSAARGFVGLQQWNHFKDSVRTTDGRVPAEPTERFLNSLLEALGNANASSTS